MMAGKSTHYGEVWTVGHSNQTIEDFLSLLESHGIGRAVDVRRFPGSRRDPHFEKSRLGAALCQSGIGYEHWPELGGRRQPRPDSANTNWKNAGFRGYADYMETREFGEAMARLLPSLGSRRTALMCAEALWWQCHRSLIADYLKSIGLAVQHILAEGKTQGHPYTSAARIVEGRLSYAGESLFDQPQNSASSR